MKIKIDPLKCVGCGRCTEICPKTFRLGADGKAAVIEDSDLVCANKASDNCPTGAIDVEE